MKKSLLLSNLACATILLSGCQMMNDMFGETHNPPPGAYNPRPTHYHRGGAVEAPRGPVVVQKKTTTTEVKTYKSPSKSAVPVEAPRVKNHSSSIPSTTTKVIKSEESAVVPTTSNVVPATTPAMTVPTVE